MDNHDRAFQLSSVADRGPRTGSQFFHTELRAGDQTVRFIHNVAVSLQVLFRLTLRIVPGEGSFAGRKRWMAHSSKERRDGFTVGVLVGTDTITMMEFTLSRLFPHQREPQAERGFLLGRASDLCPGEADFEH